MPDDIRPAAARAASRAASSRRRRAAPPDPEFAWMAIIVGALLLLGGAGLTLLSFRDGDGRAALWMFLGTVGIVGVVIGVSGLIRASRERSPEEASPERESRD